MVLRPETDPQTGELRLVGTDFPENTTFFPGELGVFTQGVFFLGGNDTVQGSSDPELIRGNLDNDLIRGGDGNDTLLGGQGIDSLLGEGGNDAIFGELDNDILFGNLGEDTLFGGPGNDEANGGQGNDVFFGGPGIDTLNGDSGDDLIQGENDEDFLFGGQGNDVILGGFGSDIINGEAGDDVIRGEQDSDFLVGGEDNDLIFGGTGDDRILGEAGNDRLYGDKGRDTLIGGEGNDIFFIEPGTGGNTPTDANFLFDFQPGIDTIALVGDFPFDSLNITEDPRDSNNTLIQAANGEYLAVVQRVSPDRLTRSNFFIPGFISFNSSQFTVNENGTPINPITVTRSVGEDGAASVVLTLTPVGIITPEELDTTPISVNFANGDATAKTIALNITNNNIVDYPRQVQLSLENPTGSASIGIPAQATLEILDDEPKIEPQQTIPHPLPETNANFGFAVEQVTTNILVGAPGQNNTQGSAYLFDAVTGQPIQIFNHPFPATAGNAQLGRSLTAFGADVVIGAPQDSTIVPQAGAVYQFSSSTGVAYQLLSDPTPEPFENFGFAVDSIGNTIIVGAPTSNTLAPRSGVAYLFDGNSGQLLQTFNNPEPTADSYFGASVAAVGDKVLIGAPGSLTGVGATKPGVAYLFDSITGELLQTFRNPNPGIDDFGRGLAWTNIGRDVLIGAPGDDTRGTDTGAAFLFDGITGTVLQTYSYPQPRPFDRFGEAIDIVNTSVFVGAPGYGSLTSGAVFRHQLRTGELLDTYINTIPDNGDERLNFGASVAAVGNTWVTGVPGYDVGGVDVGRVYQFA
jgi:hypothetical protein